MSSIPVVTDLYAEAEGESRVRCKWTKVSGYAYLVYYDTTPIPAATYQDAGAADEYLLKVLTADRIYFLRLRAYAVGDDDLGGWSNEFRALLRHRDVAERKTITWPRGVAFPFRFSNTGWVYMSEGARHVNEQIVAALLTNYFDRSMRPFFGVNIKGMIFETEHVIYDKLTNRIKEFLDADPRIGDPEVKVVSDDRITIKCLIEYRYGGQQQSFVMPIPVEGER